MKITRCKYGHYYDKAYFKECPHCYRARGGKDEDIIIERTDSSTPFTNGNKGINQINSEHSDKSQKEKDRENVKRWIGEAWDELEEILGEEENSSENQLNERKITKESNGITKESHEEKTVEKKLDIKESTKKSDEKKTVKEESEKEKALYQEKMQCKDLEDFMLLSAMPLKVIKNQEFCMDFCFFPEKEWETGAKMLAFKSQESIRDLKPVSMHLPAKATLHILYKDEEILSQEIEIDADKKSVFCTFPVTVTDTRDRRFHMVKVVFEISEQSIEIPLYLMPNP